MSSALRHVCRECGVKTGPAAFEHVDLEFNARRPLCPDCQQAADLVGEQCEFCDAAAEYSTEGGNLCEEHFERYAAGYRSRD